MKHSSRINDTQISQRKDEHIQINLTEDVRSTITTGLERISIIHEALPEINLSDIDVSTQIFNKKLSAPIMISSMTGGTEFSTKINSILAEVAEENSIAMGVGSQRLAIEFPKREKFFSIIRKIASRTLLFANIGAVQLNYGYTFNDCKKAIDMIEADAIILHLNPLQEALQIKGNTNFSQLAKKIESICIKTDVPVIVKEVGWGISKRTAKILAECGVTAIDVAGAGGTNWSKVERYRNNNESVTHLASSFNNWGISTLDSINNVTTAAPELMIFASGGLQDGVDITKCLALGASLGGMAGKFLHAANTSLICVQELINMTIEQIRLAMFCSGVKSISMLSPSIIKENYTYGTR